VFAYVGSIQNLKDLKDSKQATLPFHPCCSLRKGELFAYVGLNQNLKDLKARCGPSALKGLFCDLISKHL